MTAPAGEARPLRLGTRKSPMAMAQSQQVARLITERTGREVELVGITTFGDVSPAQLAQIGGTGVFVSGLRTSLLARRHRHSRALPEGPAHRPARGHGAGGGTAPGRSERRARRPRGAKLADLPPGATIGTGSPAGPPSCCCCARTCARCRSAATRDPARAVNPARSTPCAGHAGWPGSAGWTR